MVTKYRVIKPFGCAKKNDIFSLEDGTTYYSMVSTRISEHKNETCFMEISKNYAEQLLNGGNLEVQATYEEEEVEQEPIEVCGCKLKLDAVKAFITDIKSKYIDELNNINTSNKQLGATYTSLEGRATYANMIKLLNEIEKIVNE